MIRFTFSTLIFSLGLLCLLGTGQSAPILSVVVDGDSVTITGKQPSQGVQLREILPHEVTLPDRVIPIARGADGNFTVKLPRRIGGRDRIYSRWTFGDVKQATWATEVGAAAAYTGLKPMVAKTRKGVGGIHPDPRLFGDLVDLGIGHITVNILMRPEFSQGQVAQLDRLLKFAHEHGIVVTAILLVPPRGSVLAHPDCDPSGKYAMPNLTNAAGANAFAQSVRFLAERYCKPAAPHGRISHWIIGNEVDAGWVWTNAGEKTAEEYMEAYHRALRVAYYSVRGFDPHAKVFISLTHHWNSAHKPNPKRFYKPRRLLHLLKAHCESGGDFEWGLAYHPYPDDLFNPKTWEDKKALDTLETPLITMKNIALLDRFMHQPAFFYRGKKLRTVLLSEQGYHTAKKNPEAENLQARAISYAWDQMRDLKSIEAFHYHRWIDHEREGGLNAGLWTVKKGSITWPERKKKSWYVYRDLDRKSANLDRSNLVPWCIVPFDAKKRSPSERVAMLKELGLRRCAYDWRAEHVAEFEEEILEYKKHGIEFFAFWGVHEKAFALFEKHKIHPQIWRTAPSPKGTTQKERVTLAADALEPLAKRTASLGCKLGLYNHGGRGGEPENLVAVCNEMKLRGHKHVGIVYNWHHGHGHIDDWPAALRLMQPHLLCLNLNGMNPDAKPKILALGKGEHEGKMLEAIVASGYAGPIGILDHQNETDSKEALEANLRGLEKLIKELPDS